MKSKQVEKLVGSYVDVYNHNKWLGRFKLCKLDRKSYGLISDSTVVREIHINLIEDIDVVCRVAMLLNE